MKKVISVVCLLVTLLRVVCVPVGAATAYQTYTYSIDGQALYSPDAYVPVKTIDYQKMGLDVNLNDARDIITDERGNVYIADTANNRIVVLDRYYNLKFEIKDFRNDQMIMDKFNQPRGVFVTENRYEVNEQTKTEELKYPGRIYVCDWVTMWKWDATAYSIRGRCWDVIPMFTHCRVYGERWKKIAS